MCTPKCDTFGSSFSPLLSIMKCYKPNRSRIFASFGNLVNVLHNYQLIQVGSSSQMVSTLERPFSGLVGIELGFLRQQSCNQGETIC